ncbi:hypothetical protein [Flavobacterium hibernum]|uniref:Uncharacterized protein n=1 Tax=Flavobacterium hibernum TaxID=37752 RepID=A0A0D0EFG6_9FLAO|nr:hypothetical protein [Flavobacterium hibernum]KIO54069.1 hypothetical protein IW18_03450 [Flavobacterium hibernum]OXA86718.1 hypothetical protein B0A73_13635 [Flavobacterium hibernum]STO18832.1 Uncharacterised protein [Flavobacterium hibernum]
MSLHFKIFLLAATVSFISLIDILNVHDTRMKAQITNVRAEKQKVKMNQNSIKRNGFKTTQLKID